MSSPRALLDPALLPPRKPPRSSFGFVLLPPGAPGRSRHLSPRAAFYLQVSMGVAFLAGSSAPTPLYSVYQAAWGFSPVTVTVIFGIYAMAVLAALLTFGSLSDHIGRRPVLLAAIALQATTMLVFANAGGVSALLLARIIQGLSTGAAVGALGAGLLDIDREKGTVANSVGPMTGTALGGLISGLMVQYLPAPTRLVYLTLFVVFVVQGIGVALMRESVQARAGAWASLRPHLALPAAVRRPMLLAAPAVVATWSLVGLYGSLGPVLVRGIMGSTSVLWGGLTLLALAGSGAIAVALLHTRPARWLMSVGTAALLVGVGITMLAVNARSGLVFFAGAIVAGVGFGAGFQGAIRTVLPLAAPRQRAGVLSVLYVVSYLAMGLPAVIAGLGVVYGGGLLPSARAYGIVVMILAALALIGTLVRRPASETAVIPAADAGASSAPVSRAERSRRAG